MEQRPIEEAQQNVIDCIFDELALADREITVRVIKSLHPEWTMAEVSFALEDPEKLEKLLLEVSKLENRSIEDLPAI